MEEILKQILAKLNGLETKVKTGFAEVKTGFAEVKTGFEGVNKKLDTIYAQVAHNTEQEVKLNSIANIVDNHETDIKLIKKVVINQ